MATASQLKLFDFLKFVQNTLLNEGSLIIPIVSHGSMVQEENNGCSRVQVGSVQHLPLGPICIMLIPNFWDRGPTLLSLGLSIGLTLWINSGPTYSFFVFIERTYSLKLQSY